MIQIEDILSRRPLPGGVLLRGIPVAHGREDHLIRQVMALANADLEGPRCLMFGAEHGAAAAPAVIGMSDADVTGLEEQCRMCIEAIEPALELYIETATVAGKTVAALVIGGCADPPYIASDAAPPPLQAGECWLFDAQGMRPASRADLDAMYATRRQRRQHMVLVGLGADPRCELLEIAVPDASHPPSRSAAAKLAAAIKAKLSAAAILGREDTGMARLAHARIFGMEMPFRDRGLETLRKSLNAVPEEYQEADRRYRLEDCAVPLNLCIMNGGDQPLRSVVLQLKLPAVPGLEIANSPHRLSGPGEADAAPEVSREKKSFRVRATLDELAGGSTSNAFRTPLRIAVDKALIGQKIAIHYSLGAEGLLAPTEGRLRIKFRRV